MPSWEQRRERSERLYKAETDLLVAELEARTRIAQGAKTWEELPKVPSRKPLGWMDEYVLLLWSLPMIGLFIPGLRDTIQAGFEVMKTFNEDAPTYYFGGWGIIMVAVFGLKNTLSGIFPNGVFTKINSK